jgi:hypothetical protein
MFQHQTDEGSLLISFSCIKETVGREYADE